MDSLPAAPAAAPAPPPGAWTCAHCTFVNANPAKRACGACRKHRFKRGAGATPPPPSADPPAAAAPAAAPAARAPAPGDPAAAAAAPTNTVGGYAARLSAYPNKGVTGLAEQSDSARVLEGKLARLAALFAAAERVRVLTGAGISTAAGIPDFRGPRGIWTLEDEAKRSKGRKRRKAPAARGAAPAADGLAATVDAATAGASFETATPTPTHMALVKLAELDKLTFVATQNVDGLHVRSGFPRRKLGVLHGCVFTERCATCAREYVRDRDLGGISFRPTGRRCDCGGPLVDTVLDWDDGLPDSEWVPATRHFREADLVITLGTSLRIIPAGELPLEATRFVVVNLQPTPYDGKAALVIRARVDAVMTALLASLGLAVPPPPARGRAPRAISDTKTDD